MNTIEQCMRYAATREEFISLMKSEGYEGALDREQKEHHLYHACRNEVPG